MSDCPVGIENRERLAALEKSVNSHIDDNERDISIIFTKLDEIKDKLIYRPTWVVAVIFSILTGAIGVLATFLSLLISR